MSFGFGGGFGQSNQQSPGFGTGSGFGNTGSGGFGSTSTSSPFGSAGGGGATTGGSLFGNTSGNFGSGGGFGSNTQNQSNSLFGSQNRTSGFGTGTTSGGSLFGGNTSTAGGTGFGGFGSPGNTGGTGGFGSPGTGGAFGNKPAGAFGSSPSTGGSFGTGGGFGSNTTGFGGSAGSAFPQPVPPCEGTGGTPFNPFVEKDSGPGNMTNHYQAISMMGPYTKYSPEELRLADYERGRRFGNGSGQAGSFGSSAFGGSGGFGTAQPTSGFGNTGSPFGGGTSAPSGFGTPQTQTTGGFGGSSSNPLFGASKPATSMFGGGSGTSQGGIFGGGGSTPTAGAGGFGSNQGTGGFGTGGSSLFGSNNQQPQQNKPLFGGSTGTTGGTGFGGFNQQQTTGASNPFGASTATSSPFGGGQQQTGTGFSGFNQPNQAQNQNQTQGKSPFGGGGFGTNNQQQPSGTGLFGSGNTGSSLFGTQNNQQQQQQPAGGSSLFGGNTNQQQSGTSLFGGGAQQGGQKSLFGTSTTGAGTGTGGFSGFGNSQNQQPAGGGLFGGTQNQQPQQKPSLFGNTGTGTGGGLFGGPSSTPQNTGSSLFGSTQNQQPQTGGLGTSSLFGAPQQTQPQQQQPSQPAPGSFQASIYDPNPYGHQSIFSGLPAPSAQSPGPLATPLSSSVKQKQSQRTPLPLHRMTPSAANRYITPPKRQGYGFSYSTYGSPSSVAGTPNGLGGGSLLGSGSLRGGTNGSLGRGFGKSLSTSNLRKSFDPDTDSVLSPGAFSGQPRLSSSNLKRLTIDRSLRNDLFTRSPNSASPAITNGEDSTRQTEKAKKRVSFDATPANGVNGTAGGEIVRVEDKSPDPTPEELGFLRSIRKSSSVNGINGSAPSSDSDTTIAHPEMESVRGSGLPVVPEHEQSPSTDGESRLSFTPPESDPKPGEYWMKPSRAEISKMSRDQQKRIVDFTVGRQQCGKVTFDEPVDLTTVDLDLVFGVIVDIGLRRITVYPDESMKPTLGKGLNVPSTLRIENSWPRGKDRKSPSPLTSGPLFEKHLDRLRKVTNTEFVDYQVQTGTWVFKVPHFTTYGLDYDDEDEGESVNHGTMSAAPDTPKAHSNDLDQTMVSEPTSTFSTDDSFVGSMAGVDDDTFDFKKRKIVPGSFGSQEMAVEADDDHEMGSAEDDESFLEEGSTGSTEQYDATESQRSESEVGSNEDTEMNMAGSFPDLHHTVGQDDTQSTDADMENTQRSMKPWNTPSKARLNLTGDWTDQLQRTISPRKQNRDALREVQANAFTDRPLLEDAPKKTTGSRQKGFSTSIDLMNSLFQQPRKQQPQHPSKQTFPSGGLEWPYTKQPKTFAGDSTNMTQQEAAFHDSFKPRWGPMDTLICAKSGLMKDTESGASRRWEKGISVTSEGRDISLLKFAQKPEPPDMINIQLEQSVITKVDNIPSARLANVDLQSFAKSQYPQSPSEPLIWALANVLFNNDYEDDISAGMPVQLRAKYAHRIKKDRLSRLWESIIYEMHIYDMGKADSPEERAFELLSVHRVEEACKVLIESRNFNLATLITQVGRDRTVQIDMAKQIEAWRQNNVLSEMSEPIRGLYELVAGNALHSEGKSTGALEDRWSAFNITDRFGLDWLQAFGLRLWYGTTENEPIEAAVIKLLEDIESGFESARPRPFFFHGKGKVTFAEDTAAGESPLWTLLKLYSATVGRRSSVLPTLDFPGSILPESVSGDKLDYRLPFQLHQALVVSIGQHTKFHVNAAQANQLVWDYAWQLVMSDQYCAAIFVLLHLSRPVDRERAVKETLARFAAEIPEPVNADGTTDTIWQFLTVKLQFPEAWIWVAKALYARDTGDAAAEVGCLIHGKHWNDAHATFCRVVAPTAVIERDYATLESLVSGFGESPDRRVRGWESGGGVYEDFLRLTIAAPGRREPRRLDRLVNALVVMGENIGQGSGIEGLEERVAFKEMSQAVASWAASDGSATIESSSVLNLPLTGDARVVQTAEMSRRYYSVIMAGAY